MADKSNQIHRYKSEGGSFVERVGPINLGPEWKLVSTRDVDPDLPVTGWVEQNDPDAVNVIEADPDNPAQLGNDALGEPVKAPAKKAASTTKKAAS